MTVHHHDLASEFPEFKETIHTLKTSNAHFAKVFGEYEEVDREVVRIEQQIQNSADDYTEALKKKRLALKDELYAMLQAA